MKRVKNDPVTVSALVRVFKNIPPTKREFLEVCRQNKVDPALVAKILKKQRGANEDKTPGRHSADEDSSKTDAEGK